MLTELPVVEQRYLAAREALGGASTDVATRRGVDRRSVHRWLLRYAKEGLVALADQSGGSHAADLGRGRAPQDRLTPTAVLLRLGKRGIRETPAPDGVEGVDIGGNLTIYWDSSCLSSGAPPPEVERFAIQTPPYPCCELSQCTEGRCEPRAVSSRSVEV